MLDPTTGADNGHTHLQDAHQHSTFALSSQAREVTKDIAFGSVAGIAGKFIEYPFDTVKVRLQSQPDVRPLRYSGPLDCFKQSLREDGVRGLYRGISAPLVGAAVETSSLFFSYRLAQDVLRATIFTPQNTEKPEQLPIAALLFCGSVSGAFTSLFLTPIELIKCKLQVTASSTTTTQHLNQQRLRNPLTLIASIYRQEGLLQFWHGQLGTLIRETGGSAAWFGSYEGMKLGFRRLQQRNSKGPASKQPNKDDGEEEEVEEQQGEEQSLPVYQQMLSGAVAGMSYNALFYPADTVKSVMQTEELVRGGGKTTTTTTKITTAGKKTFLTVSRELWRTSGIKGFYRGCAITVLRAAPSSAFIFSIYEALRRAFP